MAKNCNCSGASCSCTITGGSGIKVTGTGTAANPFVVTADVSTLAIGNSIAVSSTPTIEFGKRGTGALGDPVVITGQVVVRSPNGTRFTLAVSDAGVLTTTAAGATPTGGSGAGGQIVVQNDILYWSGTAWDVRTSSAHAIWVSLGYNGVPVPPGFKAGDTWLCEAT